MATISNTPRPGYVFDVTDNVWYPIGTGTHSHSEIASTIVDAKGDIIAASAADTPARLAVGNNGETLVADSSTSTGLRYKEDYAAGKNKIINGDFGVWQRGTSFTPTSQTYTSDRFAMTSDGSGATRTITQQTFTLGTAPVAGYEEKYFLRYNQSVAGSGGTGNYLYQRIEDVRTFAGQTVTLSFWAKADAARVVSLTLGQLFGSGGSPSSQVDTSLGSVTLTTSWVRYTATVAVPSIAGKTIGTDSGGLTSSLQVLFTYPTNATMTIDLWGVQLEESSVATAFQTATGTLQGELAACQRYYQKSYAQGTNPGSATADCGVDIVVPVGGTGAYYFPTRFPVEMRGTPTITIYDQAGTSGKVTKGANGKTAVVASFGSAGFTAGTSDATSATELIYQYTSSAEL